MAAKILDGKACAEKIYENLTLLIQNHKFSPVLVIYRIGDDPASAVYVRNKVRAAEKIGITTIVREYAADTAPMAIINQLAADANDIKINGMMIQLPLPKGWDPSLFIYQIPPEKDVDGLTYDNAGRMFIDDTQWHVPCTASGIMYLLHDNNIYLSGKHVVVVGRSEIVGKPAALEALAWDATVTICHSRTKNLATHTSMADILIVAVGKPNFITADMVKPGAIVIDVGINRTEGGKLVGDVDFDNVKEVASAISPVPGGVGPMTVAMLMRNTYRTIKQNRGE